MIVFFSAAAEAEMEQAYDYLETQRPGLGNDLVSDIEAGVRQISEHPLRWPEEEPGFRRYRLRRFKYKLIYRIRSNQAEIVSVWHLSRRPGGWRANVT
jgi:plasmid stabilization system protein ParE